MQNNPQDRAEEFIADAGKLNELELLQSIYQDVSDWLKFAEAKNGALLTLVGVLLFGILSLLAIPNPSIASFQKTIFIVSAILLINMVILLFSFIPSLNESKNIRGKSLEDISSLNHLFYGDIALLTKSSYVESLKKHYSLEMREQNPYLNDYALQIVILSKIAVKKYKIFNVSTVITMLAIIFLLGKVIFSILER